MRSEYNTCSFEQLAAIMSCFVGFIVQRNRTFLLFRFRQKYAARKKKTGLMSCRTLVTIKGKCPRCVLFDCANEAT